MYFYWVYHCSLPLEIVHSAHCFRDPSKVLTLERGTTPKPKETHLGVRSGLI